MGKNHGRTKSNSGASQPQPSASGSAVPSNTPVADVSEGSSAPDENWSTSIKSHIANFEKFLEKGTRPRPPTSRYYKPKEATLGIQLLQHLQKVLADHLLAISLPSELDPDGVAAQPFLAFYAEWRAFFGPDPNEPMAPATPFERDVEAMMFMTLFPYGVGHYLGPTGHPVPLTFEEYAGHRLQIVDERFRRSQPWLLWALSRTESRDLAAAINCALMLFHKTKARHRGNGDIQVLDITDDFEVCRLINGKLVQESA